MDHGVSKIVTLCSLKGQGTLVPDAQDINASEPVTFKWVTLTTFALEGKENPKFIKIPFVCLNNISAWFCFFGFQDVGQT